MTTFENIEIQVTQNIDIDFEVYCNTCGAGLCSESDTRKSRSGYLQVWVNVCPNCIKEKEDLENKIFELEMELENKYIECTETVQQLEDKISKLEMALYKIKTGTHPSDEREAFIFVDIAKQIASEALS